MKFIWPESARAELRTVDREIAIRILHALTEYGESGAGDVKALAGQWQGHFRIRVGDYLKRRVGSLSRDPPPSCCAGRECRDASPPGWAGSTIVRSATPPWRLPWTP